MAPSNHPWVFIFGLLGNVISFMVYFAPVPTFWRIYKKKSTEGFQSLPYISAIFSAMLWIYYALLKTNSFLLITINGFGCVIETIYVAIFLVYASRQAKVATFKLLVLLNLFGFSSVILVCSYLAKASVRVHLLGWICVAFSVVVFAAPLSVIRMVIRTKSVEFMPLPLSLTLTVSAVMWFMYGVLQRDLYIALPNVFGFTFGVAQMGLYMMYRNHPKTESKDVEKEAQDKTTRVNTTYKSEVHPVNSPLRTDEITAEAVVVENPEENNVDVGVIHDDSDSRLPRELHVQSPSSCVVGEIIKTAESETTGAIASVTTHLIDCVV